MKWLINDLLTLHLHHCSMQSNNSPAILLIMQKCLKKVLTKYHNPWYPADGKGQTYEQACRPKAQSRLPSIYLIMLSSNSGEGCADINEIYGCPIFKWVTVTWLHRQSEILLVQGDIATVNYHNSTDLVHNWWLSRFGLCCENIPVVKRIQNILWRGILSHIPFWRPPASCGNPILLPSNHYIAWLAFGRFQQQTVSMFHFV